MIYIFDACAMIAFLRKELGSIIVEEILLDKNNRCFAHAINLCEVFYDFHRLSGEQAAEKAISDLKQAGIIERNDFDQKFWKEVGRTKSQNRASLADCIAVVLVNQLGGTILTSDHHEFDKLAQDSVCSIQFIR